MAVDAVDAAVTALHAAHEALAELPAEMLIRPELLRVLDEIEALNCRLPSHRQRILARLQIETTPKAMGAKSWRDVLATRWRISSSEAGRRLDETAQLGPRQTFTGQPLEPVLPAAAAAQAHGLINGEHVTVLRDAMAQIPAAVDVATRGQIEADWVRKAVGAGPKQLKDHAARTLFLMDQDGPLPDEPERQRRRSVSIGPQQTDKMTQLKGAMTPRARATFEAIFAAWAAPGMCNPADESPCLSGTPTQAQIDGDHRTLGQRQHDALEMVGRWVLEGRVLGQHNGLPATIIIRTTLQDLESRAGIGVTGGGSVIPISDVIALASESDLFLAVFDKATGSALDLFRARRTASTAQRIMLIARDGGCTKPNCTVPAYGSQVHHAARDWADGGNTNVDEMGLACGPDNRMVGPDGWKTQMNDRHEVEWIPPESLDSGQPRVNTYHRPEQLHQLPEEQPAPKSHGDHQTQFGEPGAAQPPDDIDQPGGPEPNAA